MPARVINYITSSVLALLTGVLILIAGMSWVGSRLTAPAPAHIGASPNFLPAQPVQFPTSRGRQLSGWYVPGRPECGTVILMHGIRVNRLSMVERARFLHGAGYTVLLFDLQSHGQSEGEGVTFGDLEKEDARAAVIFVSQRRPLSRIGVIGFSLGGAAAVLNGSTLGADALILEAVYTTLENAVTNRVRLRVGPLAPLLAEVLLFHLEHYYGIRADNLRPIEFVPSLGIPVFIIGGTHDQHTNQSETQALFSMARSPKELWLVKGAQHWDFHQYAAGDYEARVLAFLDAHVGCTAMMRK